MTTWFAEIENEMVAHDETMQDDAIMCTISDDELRAEIPTGYGGSEGKPFTLWTLNRVYFPADYDGGAWVSSVPRNPCDESTYHVGGERKP